MAFLISTHDVTFCSRMVKTLIILYVLFLTVGFNGYSQINEKGNLVASAKEILSGKIKRSR